MSSSADIVTRALKRLGIIGSGETPSAQDAADGLSALNAMIAGWQADGVDLSAEVPLPARHEEGIVALLAVRLASDYGATPPQQVLADAANGWQRLQNEYIRVPTATVDTALINIPSRRLWIGTSRTQDWEPKRDYAVGDTVQWLGRIYECTTAGTSASSYGPRGFDSSVTDGSVVWKFLKVL